VEKWAGSGNVYENKGSYVFKAGMYMKTRKLILSRYLRPRQYKTEIRPDGQANPDLISHAMPRPLERRT
jgi:hypothetical protein